MQLAGIILFAASIVALVIAWIIGRYILTGVIWAHIAFIGVAIVLMIAGGTGTVLKVKQIKEAFSYRQWPTTMGKVISSKVVGDRGYRPEIRYEYRIEGKTYQNTSHLNLPNFGGRINRLDAAETTVESYPEGKRIKVYYNPFEPENAYLNISPPAWVYLQGATYLTLFMVGSVLLLLHFVARQRQQSL